MVPDASKWKMLLVVRVSAPVMSLPTEAEVPDVPDAPALIVPPDATFTLPYTSPVPPRVPPLFTVIPDPEAVLPFTNKVPPLICVAPVYVLVPERIQVPIPDLATATFPPADPSEIGPTEFEPVFKPLKVRVEVLLALLC